MESSPPPPKEIHAIVCRQIFSVFFTVSGEINLLIVQGFIGKIKFYPHSVVQKGTNSYYIK
jgi:hypothetical protein